MAWWHRRAQTDFDAEIRAHLDLEAERLEADGLSPREAHDEARRRFGNVTRAQERYHDSRRPHWVDAMLQDLRYAVRQLRRAPFFAAVVVLTLALGIGANSIIFGVVDRLLLRPPAHVAAPERLVRIYFREQPPARVQDRTPQTSDIAAYPTLGMLREQVPALEGLAGTTQAGPTTMGRGADAQQVDVSAVTGEFFHLLGVRPTLGRLLVPDDDRLPSGSQVAVISHGFWQRHFGGTTDVMGRELPLGARTFFVVGVAPKGFTGVDLGNVDLWVPASAFAPSRADWATNHHMGWIRAIGRLKPGATPEQAGAAATVAYRRLAREGNTENSDTLGQVLAGPIVAARGPTDSPREARISLWLVGVSGVVLLVACANVANLLLARAVRRRREIAVRLALGVSRGRLVRQLLTETLVLAVLAAAASLLLAHWGGQVVRSLLLPGIAWGGSPVEPRVLAFTVFVTFLTVLLAGLAPALQASRPDLASALRAGAREAGGRRSAVRTGLLVAQAALSVVLLVGAGVFVRSLNRVHAVDVGIDLPRVLLVRTSFPRAEFTPPRIRELWQESAERVRRLPGVEHVALVGASSPMSSSLSMPVGAPGRDSLPPLPNGGPFYSAISPEFFVTIGARVVRGRALTEEDERYGARVVVVNELVARHYWPDLDPLGECLTFGDDRQCTQVVGVVQDVMQYRMLGDEHGVVYLPLTHPAVAGELPNALLVRASGDVPEAAASVRRALQSLVPGMRYVSVRSFEELVEPELQPWRLGASMFSVFGGLALLIAAVGLYSVLAYTVSQRANEIGVRMALGAARGDVVRLVVRDGLCVAAVGVAVGLALAVAAGPLIVTLLYRTSPRDPATLAGVAAVLLVVALVASALPAWRASRVEPSIALRVE